MTQTIRSEDAPSYTTGLDQIPDAREDSIIAQAIEILAARLKRGPALCSPDDTAHYLRLVLGSHEREVFALLLLDNRHRVIKYTELFYGTIDGASVHPREIVKEVLEHNAAAVILAHNHPSGETKPSHADIRITEKICAALALIEVRVLDHLIVSECGHYSLADHSLIPY